MRQLNSACLSKLGWRVLDEGKALWAQVLKSKYGRGHTGMDLFRAKPNDSHIWKGIFENAQTIQRGVGVALGDGRSTKFWLHDWATPSALLDLAQSYVPAAEQTRMDHDCWEEGQG